MSPCDLCGMPWPLHPAVSPAHCGPICDRPDSTNTAPVGPSSGLAWMPVALLALIVAMLAGTYVWAVTNGDVYPIFPYISDTGAEAPERSYFSMCMCLGSALLYAIVLTRWVYSDEPLPSQSSLQPRRLAQSPHLPRTRPFLRPYRVFSPERPWLCVSRSNSNSPENGCTVSRPTAQPTTQPTTPPTTRPSVRPPTPPPLTTSTTAGTSVHHLPCVTGSDR